MINHEQWLTFVLNEMHCKAKKTPSRLFVVLRKVDWTWCVTNNVDV
jgi:hypothetical protein